MTTSLRGVSGVGLLFGLTGIEHSFARQTTTAPPSPTNAFIPDPENSPAELMHGGR